MMNRRRLLGLSAGAALFPLASKLVAQSHTKPSVAEGPVPEAIAKLPSFDGRVAPFTNEERVARIRRAQVLMDEQKIQAIVLADLSTSTNYFANLTLWPSERLWVLVIPAKGKSFFVCPHFERERALEILADTPLVNDCDVLTWEEDESPFALVVDGLRGRGITSGKVGLDENLRYQFVRELATVGPGLEYVSALPITAGCRMIKEEHELECMRVAGEATLAVYEAVYKSVQEGMTSKDVRRLIDLAYAKVGLEGEASLNIDEFTAMPHGSRKPQTIHQGSIMMIDDGCLVHGYTSDITRTFCLGKPSDKQRKVFDIVRTAQKAALKAARPGVPVGSVDLAARKVIEDAGFGPGHKYFTHRLGHGIGLDGHEWPYLSTNNMFLGERAPLLKPNMTFSDEPGVYILGEFGVRLEDELHITADGAELLTPPSESLDEPFARG